jgi:hypothetical protein
MSAFIVPKEHIDALLTWANDTPEYGQPRQIHFRANGVTGYAIPYWENLDHFGQLLTEANQTSVNARYSENEPPEEYHWSRFPRKLSPVEVIKACHCFSYQACEYDGWKDSKAKQIIDDLRESAVRLLPGYENAAWSIDA